MKPENLDLINRSFALQAMNFESRDLQFSREESRLHPETQAYTARTAG